MNIYEQAGQFDPEEAGRSQAQELIRILATKYHTAEAFIEAVAKVRRALLEVFDTVDPAQIVESAWQNGTPAAIQVRQAGESEQRRKDRGSLQDPLYPPMLPKRWD
jgi:hypothetical protein